MGKTNQHGIGLIEALLAVGIVGGLALVITQFGQNARKAVNNLETTNDVKVTLQQIESVLSDQDSCTTTLGGRNASNATNAVQALRKKHATGYADAYKTISSSPTTTYGQKQLKINSYSISDSAPEVDVAQGTTQLLVNFNRGKSGIQAESITQKVNLKVTVDGAGNITSCVAYNPSSSDIWTLADNNSDIYFNTGGVAVGVNAPTYNLTVRATTFPLQPGIAIHGNENGATGWNRAALNYSDSSSSSSWSVGLFGASSVEGEGKFGINLNGSGNRVIFTKNGNMGVGTTRPNCEQTSCENSDGGRWLHVHSNGNGANDYSTLFLSSDAMGANKIVGSLAFGSNTRTEGHDRRTSAITGNVTSSAGTPLKGVMLFWSNDGSGNDYNMILDEVGNLGIFGGTYTTTGVHERSDRRLKKNIESLPLSNEKILKLQGVSFEWKDRKHPGTQLGLIAQDVEKVFPETVGVSDRGDKTISYSSLLAPIVNSIKEIYSSFHLKTKRLEKLKTENKALKNFLCSEDPMDSFCSEKGQ